MKKLIRIATNGIICIMLLVVFSLTYNFEIKDVFKANDSNNAYYCGNIDKPNASLMVNVYWGNEYIPVMLNIFKENNIKTTFFVGGSWVARFPELLKLIYDDDHEIGNHGYNHKEHAKLSQADNLREMKVTHEIVKKEINYDITLFAPPSGSFNATTTNIASSLNYKTIMWTKDTIDWRDKDTNLIVKRATKNIKNGDLILMHPTEHTTLALPAIINAYNLKNIKLTTVTETVAIP